MIVCVGRTVEKMWGVYQQRIEPNTINEMGFQFLYFQTSGDND